MIMSEKRENGQAHAKRGGTHFLYADDIAKSEDDYGVEIGVLQAGEIMG